MDMDIEDSPVGQANGKKRRVRKGEGEGGGDDQNAEGENPDQEPSVVVRPPPRKRRRVAECKRHFIPNAGDRYMLVVIRRGEHEDVRISQRYKAWASTRDHTVTFSNAYKEASQHGGRLALFFTVYTEHPRDRALYGMAVMRSLPRPGTAGKVRWKSKYHWGDLFDVEWYYQDSAPPSGSLNMGCWTAPDSSSISLAYAKAMLASMERWTGEMIAEDPMDSMYDDPIEAFKKMRAARPTIELEEEDEEENDAGGRPGGEGAVPIEEQPDTSVKIPEEWAAPRPLSDDYFDPDKADLNFCMYDIDQSTMPSIDTAENGKPAFDRIRSPEVPVVRIYGTTKEGYTVVCLVRGFMPYFYIRAPRSMQIPMRYDRDKYTEEVLSSDPAAVEEIANDPHNKWLCREFRETLNARLQSELNSYEKNPKNKLPLDRLIVDVEFEWRQSMTGFCSKKKEWFVKITLLGTKFVKRVRSILQHQYLWCNPEFWTKPEDHECFEADVPFELRFMVDIGLEGAAWVTLPKGSYRRWDSRDKRVTHAPIEVLCSPRDLIPHSSKDPLWSAPPRLRVATLDIECGSKTGRFPEADQDPIISVAFRIHEEGGGMPQKHVGDVVFAWGPCRTSGLVVLSCYYRVDKACDMDLSKLEKGQYQLRHGNRIAHWDRVDEATMLVQIRDFLVVHLQPHVLQGHNMLNFDLPYMLNRAMALKVDSVFSCLGWSRRGEDSVTFKTSEFGTKAWGKCDKNSFKNMGGRLLVDSLVMVKQDYKLRSYTLNALSAEFLGPTEAKFDMPHQLIDPSWRRDDASRRKVVEYNWKDVELTQRIITKLKLLIDKIEMSRANKVPPKFIWERGQQQRIVVLIMAANRILKNGLLVPTAERDEDEVCEKYEGATVFPPKPGFYDEAIPTLDFSSLYPSIMMGKNMSYETWVRRMEDVAHLKREDLYEIETDSGTSVFVRQHVSKAVLAIILEEGIADRNIAKKLMAETKGTPDEIIYDRRQNALKVRNNSVYGFTGVPHGKYPCPAISRAVTAVGRQSIQNVGRMVEEPLSEVPRKDAEHEADYQKRAKAARENYPIPRDAGEGDEDYAARIRSTVTILYGDTDSVMVRLRIKDTKRAIELGKAYASWISTYFFDKPMVIAFEKIYFPFLLITKKRYAGTWWTKPEVPDKQDEKGLESVRRDNSLAAKGMVKNLISFLLKERDVRKAVESVDRLVHSLMDDTIDRAELVISKGLSKRPDDPVYGKTQAHARLARKMEKRNPATAPKLGDRVPYIIIDKGNKAKNLEKAEDPIYVLEHDIPIDKNYYIEHQLRQPFERILEPILPGITEAMFSRHSSTIYLPPKGASIAVQREPEFVPRSKLPAPQNQLGLSASRKKSRKPLPGQLTLFSTDQMDLGLSRKPVGPPAKKPAAKGGLTKAQIKKYAPPPGQVDLFGKVLVEPRWTVQQKKEGYEPVNLDRSMNSESFAGNASQISHYVARGHKCLACSSPMPEFPADRPAPATCDRCLVEKVDLLSMATKADLARDALVARTEAKEKETSAMWNRCVGCQKVASLEDLDPCSNLTCDIFFRRTRSKIEMKRLYASLERFERPSKFMTITSASPMDIGGDTP